MPGVRSTGLRVGGTRVLHRQERSACATGNAGAGALVPAAAEVARLRRGCGGLRAHCLAMRDCGSASSIPVVTQVAGEVQGAGGEDYVFGGGQVEGAFKGGGWLRNYFDR